MELVYLWVEEYKNIHKQGFNFSPKFTCDYNDETNELSIDDNPDHIENFFGKDINVTAIVGKNGSGKSSIVKIILKLFYMYSWNTDITESKNIFLIIEENKKWRYLKYDNVGSSHEEILCQYNIQDIKIKELSKIKNNLEKGISFFNIYYNYMLDTLNDGALQDRWIKNTYHKVDEYKSAVLFEPKKIIDDDEKIDLELLEYITTQKLSTIYKLNMQNNFIKQFFNPNKLKFEMNKDKISNKFFLLGSLKMGNPIFQYDGTFKHNGKVFNNYTEDEIFTKFNTYMQTISIENINILYIGLKLLEHNHLMKRDSYVKLRKSFINSFDTDKIFDSFFKEIQSYNFEKLDCLKENVLGYEIQKLKNAFMFEKNILNNDIKKNLFESSINKKVKIIDIKEIILEMPPWIDINYYEENKDYKSLSSGEKVFINFIMSLMYQINNLKDTNYKCINIFLDEVELGFHPDWQKKYLTAILAILDNFELKINLYFLSHSPFIISDLPKENIIFLKNGKQVKGIEKKQTFGANIHTLLSDSFFMEDGLMGEFAKGKINDVYNFIVHHESGKIKTKEDAQDIINIIGEPLIQRELQKLFDKKFELSNMTIEDEISVLESKLKALKEIKNDTN